MLKEIAVVLPSLFVGSDPGIHYGMWIEVATTVVCDQDWSAIAVASAYASKGAEGARAELDETANCAAASGGLLIGVGDLVWSRGGVSVVRNLDPKIPYVIVVANYDESYDESRGEGP
jgi:hypothetical protein